jgi:hypothetical protein
MTFSGTYAPDLSSLFTFEFKIQCVSLSWASRGGAGVRGAHACIASPWLAKNSVVFRLILGNILYFLVVLSKYYVFAPPGIKSVDSHGVCFTYPKLLNTALYKFLIDCLFQFVFFSEIMKF